MQHYSLSPARKEQITRRRRFFPPSSVRGLKSFPFSAPFLQPHWCDTRYQSELNFGYTRRGRQRMGPYYTAAPEKFRRLDVCAYCRVAAGDKQIQAKFDTQPFVVDLFKARPRGRKSERPENIHGQSWARTPICWKRKESAYNMSLCLYYQTF